MFVCSALPHGDGTPPLHHILLLIGPKTSRKKPGVEGGLVSFDDQKAGKHPFPRGSFLAVQSPGLWHLLCTHSGIGWRRNHGPEHHFQLPHTSKKKCFSNALRHTLVVLEMH